MPSVIKVRLSILHNGLDGFLVLVDAVARMAT